MNQIDSKINGVNNNITPIKSIEERRREENNKLMEEQAELQKAIASRQAMTIGDVISEQNMANRVVGGVSNLTPPQLTDNPSRLDKKIHDVAQMENLDDARGHLQSGLSQIINGTGKGVILIGTTFLDGIIGGIAGVLNASANAISGKTKDGFRGFLNDIVDNPYSREMQEINEMSESWLPNYYTDEENKKSWHEKIFTANFIGDHFIKNLGFTIGAVYSGKVSTGALSKIMGMQNARNAFKGIAYTAKNGKTISNLDDVMDAIRRGDKRLADELIARGLEKEAKAFKRKDMLLRAAGSITAASGEARIEAIQNTKDWYNGEFKKINDFFDDASNNILESLLIDNGVNSQYFDTNGNLTQLGLDEYQLRKEEIDKNRASAIERLEKERASMANNIFLLNLPIVGLQDFWTFGRFFTGGYKEAQSFVKLVNNAAKERRALSFSKDGMPIYKDMKKQLTAEMWTNALSNVGSEGTQEMLQQSVATGSGYYGSAKIDQFINNTPTVTDYYKKRFDPDVESSSVEFFNAFINGAKDVFGDWEQWEQFAIGAFDSVLGGPTFTEVRGEDGTIVRDENGKAKKKFQLQGEVWDTRREIKDKIKQSENLTKELNKIVSDEKFVERWQNFIRHNTLEEIKKAAVEMGDIFEYKNADNDQIISDIEAFNKAGRIEDLYEMIESVENIDENNDDQVRDIVSYTINQETGTSPWDGKEKELIAQMKQNASALKKFLEKYSDVQRNIETVYGSDLDHNIKESLVWQIMTISNTEDRIKSILDKISEPLYKLISNYNYLHPDAKISERPNLVELADWLQGEDKGYLNKLQDALNDYDNTLDSKTLKRRLNQLRKYSDGLKAMVQEQSEIDSIKDEEKKKSVEESNKAVKDQIESIGKSIEQLVAMQAGFRSGEWKDVTGIDMRDLGNNLRDVIRLASRRRNFIDLLSQLSKNPASFSAEAMKVRNEYLDKAYEKKADDFVQKVSSDTSASAFKTELNSLTKRERDAVIKKIKNGSNDTLKRYVKDLEELEEANGVLSGLIEKDRKNAKSERKINLVDKANDVISQLVEISSSAKDLIENICKFCNINKDVDGKKQLVKYIFDKTSALSSSASSAKAEEKKSKPAVAPEPEPTPSPSTINDDKNIIVEERFNNVNKGGNGIIIQQITTKFDNGDTRIEFVRKVVKNGAVVESVNIGHTPLAFERISDKFKDLVIDDSSPFNTDGAKIIEILSILDDGGSSYKAKIRAKYKDSTGATVTGVVDATLRNKDSKPVAPKVKDEPVKTEVEPIVAYEPDENDLGGSAVVMQKEKDKELLAEHGTQTDISTPMAVIDAGSLRNSPISVYSIDDLKEGRLIETVITDNDLFKGYVNFLLSHRTQEFIDHGGLLRLEKIYKKRHNGEDLKIYFATNPANVSDNIFRQESEGKNGKKYVHHNIALLVEIENINDFSEFTSGDNPVFTKDNLINIDGKLYMPVGILNDPFKWMSDANNKNDEFYKAKLSYNLIETFVKNSVEEQSKTMTEEQKNRLFIGRLMDTKTKKQLDPMYTNIEIGFSGRPIRLDASGSSVQYQDAYEPISEYEKYYGANSYGFMIVHLDNGHPVPVFTDGMNPTPPPFNLTRGSLYFVGIGANGGYNYTPLQVKRADEFNIYDMPDSNYATEIKGILSDMMKIPDPVNNQDFDSKNKALSALKNGYVHLPSGYNIDFNRSGIVINESTRIPYGGDPKQIWDVFSRDRLRMQVSIEMLNKESRRDTIKSGVIETDYKSFIRRGASFNVSLLHTTKDGVRPEHAISLETKISISKPSGKKSNYEVKLNRGDGVHIYRVEPNGEVYDTSKGVDVPVSGWLANIVIFKNELDEITGYNSDEIQNGVSVVPNHPNITRYSISIYERDKDGNQVKSGNKATREIFVKMIGGKKLYARREGQNNISVVMPQNTDLIDRLNAEIIKIEENYNNKVKEQEANKPIESEVIPAKEETEREEKKTTKHKTVEDVENSMLDSILGGNDTHVDTKTDDVKNADDTGSIDNCNIV